MKAFVYIFCTDTMHHFWSSWDQQSNVLILRVLCYGTCSSTLVASWYQDPVITLEISDPSQLSRSNLVLLNCITHYFFVASSGNAKHPFVHRQLAVCRAAPGSADQPRDAADWRPGRRGNASSDWRDEGPRFYHSSWYASRTEACGHVVVDHLITLYGMAMAPWKGLSCIKLCAIFQTRASGQRKYP